MHFKSFGIDEYRLDFGVGGLTNFIVGPYTLLG